MEVTLKPKRGRGKNSVPKLTQHHEVPAEKSADNFFSGLTEISQLAFDTE